MMGIADGVGVEEVVIVMGYGGSRIKNMNLGEVGGGIFPSLLRMGGD